MRPDLPLLTQWLFPLQLAANPGQPVVIAFAHDVELRESPVLDRIRAELRGLGAALFIVTGTRVFSFRPDDELDAFGRKLELESGSYSGLREACGLGASRSSPPELSLVVVAGDGQVVARHTLEAEDALSALAQGLNAAGRDAIGNERGLTLSRREVVLASLVGAFALLVSNGCRTPQPQPVAGPVSPLKAALARKITLHVNGAPHELEIEPRVSLLDALRERLGLTGSKKGCDHGQCGACTVLIAGQRSNACLMLAIMVGDAPVTTIEGLAEGATLHPMQAAFISEDALQCGYCTPGQIVSAVGLVRENRAHTDAEVREHMSGNICRCGAYPNIIAAIQHARSASSPG